jgi:hypothetical protein
MVEKSAVRNAIIKLHLSIVFLVLKSLSQNTQLENIKLSIYKYIQNTRFKLRVNSGGGEAI